MRAVHRRTMPQRPRIPRRHSARVGQWTRRSVIFPSRRPIPIMPARLRSSGVQFTAAIFCRQQMILMLAVRQGVLTVVEGGLMEVVRCVGEVRVVVVDQVLNLVLIHQRSIRVKSPLLKNALRL